MMQFWKIVLTLIMLPKAVAYHFAGVFVSKEKAERFFYAMTVKISAKVLSMNISELKTDEPFAKFIGAFKAALFKMPFETIEVDTESDNVFKLKITRCQFVEVYKILGMTELVKALCEGDARFIEKYQPRVCFERRCTIEKGDAFCDHTFILEKS